MPSQPALHTPAAIADLDSIWDYIARDSIDAADRVLDELDDLFQRFAVNAEIGELQPNLADGHYRRFTHRSYVIYYRPINDTIIVIRVLHGARDYEALI
jgi:toxin ParE1/3/4